MDRLSARRRRGSQSREAACEHLAVFAHEIFVEAQAPCGAGCRDGVGCGTGALVEVRVIGALSPLILRNSPRLTWSESHIL